MSGPSYPPPSGNRGLVIVAVVLSVLALVVVVLAGVLVVVGAGDDDGVETSSTSEATSGDPTDDPTDDPTGAPSSDPTPDPSVSEIATARDEVEASATAFVQRFNTFAPAELDAGKLTDYRDDLWSRSTPQFATQVESAATLAERVAATGASSTFEAGLAGVQALDETTATAVVTGTTRATAKGGKPTTRPVRAALDLERIDGLWLVDDVRLVEAPVPPLEVDGAEPGATDASEAALVALPAIIGYDYRTLDADQDAARELMTPTYRVEYDEQARLVSDQAVDLKLSVVPQVELLAVSSYDGDRAEIVVLATQVSTRAGAEQRTQVAVALTMVLDDDAWLVDNLVV